MNRNAVETGWLQAIVAVWPIRISGTPYSDAPVTLICPGIVSWVRTPFGLNTSNPAVRTALGDAIRQLRKARIPLGATVGSVQHVTDHGRQRPIPGGPGDPDGIYNAISTLSFPDDSPTAPDQGSSFIQVVTWTNTACPDGATILTYPESSNPASPHHADQTRLFGKKQWLPDRFCESQIMADPQLQVTTATG